MARATPQQLFKPAHVWVKHRGSSRQFVALLLGWPIAMLLAHFNHSLPFRTSCLFTGTALYFYLEHALPR
jgi:hypothetical protein